MTFPLHENDTSLTLPGFAFAKVHPQSGQGGGYEGDMCAVPRDVELWVRVQFP